MKAGQSTVLEAARNVLAFLDANTAVIGPTITAARKNLDDAVNQLTAMAVTQETSKTSGKGAMVLQTKLRLSLRNNFMKPVATVASLFAADVPEIDALRMPKTQLRSAALVAAAQSMADTAEKYSDTFKKNGLPQDFVPHFARRRMPSPQRSPADRHMSRRLPEQHRASAGRNPG